MFIRKNTAVSSLYSQKAVVTSNPVTDVVKEMRVVEVISTLNECTSLAMLHHFYDFYKNLVKEINQSNIFFHCESGCDKTKVTIKSLNGRVHVFSG